jgi:hypothetical protein
MLKLTIHVISDHLNCVGSVQQTIHGRTSVEADGILNGLKEAYYESQSDNVEQSDERALKFPSVSVHAQSEFHGLPIFSNAYPWLFPGGVGDIDEHNMSESGYITKWVKSMTLYYDGRFCKDATFCFYALNYKQRHQNSASGAFFINDYISNQCSLDELKERIIEHNDTQFIQKLIHFSSKIRGSSAFWRAERLKVFSWVNRLIELQKGPPTLFITLSCAEHYWKDVKRLLEDRLSYTPEQERPDLSTKAAVMKAIKEFSIVVQEFFITKVKHWIQNFGKKVFGIEHYYVRFEFAEGRGEIHAHIIAVADNVSVFDRVHKCGDDNDEKIKILQEYAEKKLGLTAIHPATDSNGNILRDLIVEPEGIFSVSDVYKPSYSPCSKRMNEVTNLHTDAIQLINAVQTHKCSDYCMRNKGGQKSKRYCRAGCGVESTMGAFDTPGFVTNSKAEIRREINGTVKLALPRNSSRMIQSSVKLLQLWRANCDVQLLLYDSDPRNPNLFEISKVTDYIVSYACKGNSKMEAEVATMRSLVEW